MIMIMVIITTAIKFMTSMDVKDNAAILVTTLMITIQMSMNGEVKEHAAAPGNG